jgi:hypothetical protein
VRALVVIIAIIGACACSKPGASVVIYNELTAAGCIEPSAGSQKAIDLAMASDAAPPWFLCLTEGGTVASCSVPCGAPSR